MTGKDVPGKVGRTPLALRLVSEIVVGLDGSASAQAALRWAADQSRRTGAPLRVVHTWQLSALAAAAASPGAIDYSAAVETDARAVATRWVRDTLGDDADDLRWTLDIVEGSPGPALVARSAAARLLVIGTREHTGIRRAVVGSVSHYCLSHAAPPVVAVPAPDEVFPVDAARSAQLTGFGPLL